MVYIFMFYVPVLLVKARYRKDLLSESNVLEELDNKLVDGHKQ